MRWKKKSEPHNKPKAYSNWFCIFPHLVNNKQWVWLEWISIEHTWTNGPRDFYGWWYVTDKKFGRNQFSKTEGE
jgi:hypothetical protein